MKQFCILLMISLLIGLTTNSQTIKKGKYEKQWQKIDSLERKGLPKSALEVVEIIYTKAKTDKEHGEFIKAIMHKLKFKNNVEDGGFAQIIIDLKKEVETAEFPNNAIMHSLLAELYHMYYQYNRWKFYNRTETANFNNNDIETWSLNQLFDVVIKHYMLSLEKTEDLQKLDKSVYDEIIVKGTHNNEMRPTLFDFLSHKALDFFKSSESSLNRPADRFELIGEEYFKNASGFSQLNFTSNDTLSLHFYAIQIYRNLLKYRLEENNTLALVDVDLERLEFVYKNSKHGLADSLYLNALMEMKSTFSGSPALGAVLIKIAEQYEYLGKKYSALNPTTYKYRNYNKQALDLANQIISTYAGTYESDRATALKYRLENGSLSMDAMSAITPNMPFSVKINYKNINKVYLRICSIDYQKFKKLKEKYYYNELYEKILKESTVSQQHIINLPGTGDLNPHSTEFIIDSLPIGFFVAILSNNEEFSYKENISCYNPLFSTHLSSTIRSNYNGILEGNVVDRNTGIPIENVKVQTLYYKYDYSSRKSIKKKGESILTNSDGYFSFNSTDESNSYYLEYSLNNDFFTNDNSHYLYNYNRYKDEKRTTYNTHFFTDRAIYRPGQTIHFKGIVIKQYDEEKNIATDYKTTVELIDVNYQKVTSLELTTNEYGTFSGSFTIPLGLVNGNFQIKNSNGSKSISVEEYKRPKFETELLPIKGSYILEDEVIVKGSAKSYAGSVLSDAKVSFRVIRTPVWRGWWSYYYSSPSTEIAHGEVVTNEEGIYEIKFKSIPDLSIPKNPNASFNYSISVDVTDINGETQSTSGNVTIGYVALDLSTSLKGNISKETEEKYQIYALNLNGQKLNAKGKISIYKLLSPETALKAKYWSVSDKYLYTHEEWIKKYPGNVYKNENEPREMQKGKMVFSEDFNTSNSAEFNLRNIKNWETGHYKVELTSIDSFGNNILSEEFFMVFAEKSNRMPSASDFWFEDLVTKGEPGENAKFLIGSSNNVKILYEIEHKNKIIEKKWLDINNEQKLIEIPITENFRGNFAVHFSFIYNNKSYQTSRNIVVPYTNKELDIEFMTFRDKLQPGETEEWKIKIRGKNGEKVAAEMMATLYDASLDIFRANYFTFNINDYYNASRGRNSNDFSLSYSQVVSENFTKYHSYSTPYHDKLNWFGFNYYGYSNRYTTYTGDGEGKSRSKNEKAAYYMNGNGGNAGKKESAKLMAVAESEESGDEFGADLAKPATYSVDIADGLLSSTEMAGENNNASNAPVKVRTNFNETAFFYPHLETNKDGDLIVKFTIPESLTRWKMLGLAHTKDLKSGIISEELVTQKELMLLPNIPRFFRENDKIELPVKISNLNDKEISGTAEIEFLDAITGKPITNIIKDKNLKKDFTIKAKQNTLVTWELEIPEGLGAVEYKIIAKAGKFSDGEQNAVPVLTNRMLVTESMPLPIRGNQSKEFTFEKLVNSGGSKTLKHEKLTLEFTSNPAWYAVQALPYLIEYPYECAEQVFSRFYANSLASHVANSSPKIKKVFDSWKNTPDSKALLSNLEKNQELKALLLEETPWVLNAQNETQRKKRIGLLFDLNKMSGELQSAIEKLLKMQVSNGGWPWFKGMPESRYITQHIVCGFGHLDVLGVKAVREDSKVWNMVKKAIDYIDDRIKEDYDYLKKHYTEKEMQDKMIGSTQIHYLYTRSYFLDQPIPKRIEEAYEYYKLQAQRYWLSESKYMQGMIGLALHRMADEKTPTDIIKSLREHSINSEELGMFWKDNVGYYWYEAPIERQALLIELFDEVAKDNKAVDDMKVWLLKQKQTQDWKTTKATVEAVYALLLRGADWLESDQMVEIQLGDQIIDPKKLDGVQVEAGTGYFKTSWGKGEITPEMGKVKITKKDEGVAWGALYWQYFEQLDKITPAETPLKLEKKLFVEKMTDRGKVIEPISKNKLKVGDKIIVRIELRCDRAMEYVHMKDMRASGFEPVNVISRYKYQDGLGYYESTKDAATNFFISYLPKGTYVFEYALRVSHKGDFSNGITSIQCMYAPEFGSHSEGIRVKIDD
ncbi:MAG: hypothetical protein JXR58_06955 [Bacteroidales bacterium]|nr:hypothetical protein [Bacteroidales bacterium]